MFVRTPAVVANSSRHDDSAAKKSTVTGIKDGVSQPFYWNGPLGRLDRSRNLMTQ